MNYLAVLNEYKCPNCGGAVEFDSGSQRIKCPYCDSEFDVAAIEAANEAQNKAADDMNWGAAGEKWSEDEAAGMRVYVCNSCGGEIVADETTSATQCPYCGNQVTMKGQLSGDLRPDLIIPFKLDKNAAKEAYKKHIGNKKLLPKLFKEENHIDEIKGVYVPYWLFDCDASGSVTFSGTQVQHWSDDDYDYTRTSYYDLHRNGQAAFRAVPVDGSSKMADDLMESIEPFNLSEAVDFKAAYLAGYLADRYDVSYEENTPRANERVRDSMIQSMRETTREYLSVTPKSTNIAVNGGKVRYALYPVWILNTTYKGSKYIFAMNGQTGKLVGDLPLDKGAFWKWFGILGAGLSAAFTGLAYLFWGGVL